MPNEIMASGVGAHRPPDSQPIPSFAVLTALRLFLVAPFGCVRLPFAKLVS